MSAHGSASDPWAGWNSQPGQSAVGEAAQDVQSTTPSAAENSGSAESNSMSQGDSVTSGNTWDRSWDASYHWSWTDYGRNSSWGDAWGQSYWGPSWSSWKTGGWRRPEYEDGSWGYGAQQGHFGQTRQGSDEGGEVRSNNSSDGAARTPEPSSSEQDDHPDIPHEEPQSRTGSDGTSTTRVPGSDRDAPGGADGKGASFGEKMSVPTFDAEGSGDSLGLGARSYLRQIDAWSKVTRTPRHQQALLLYQHLSGRAWVESEELSVESLSGPDGLQVFRDWISERYQEVEVSKIAETLTTFFRKLRRQPSQTVREFNSSFDRAHSRLLEIGCKLPEVAKAWAYMSSLGLTSSEELSLLASVGNEYNTVRLQRAAVLHERSLRPPWQPKKPFDPKLGKPTGIRGAYLTGIDEENDGASTTGLEDPGDEGMSEETAFELHEAFVAQETAKQRYREVAKARGVDPAVLGSRSDPKILSDEALKQSVEQRLQAAKQRSFCAGCHRRGHWHKDPECPLNRGAQSSNKPPPAKNVHVTDAVVGDVSDGSVVQVAFEVGVEPSGQLLAITDTACSKSVAGQSWLNDYLKAARASGTEVQLIDSQDDFRFGASKLFRSTFTATIMIKVGHRSFLVRASVVHGEVPLLLSRSVLSGLGMIYDIEDSRADFKHLNIHGHNLSSTDSGHPEGIPGFRFPTPDQWGSAELYIVPESTTAYTVHMSSAASESSNLGTTASEVTPAPEPEQTRPQGIERLQLPEDYRIFYPKKIHAFVENFLSAEPMNTDIFIRWWCQTRLSKDFWIENKSQLIRVHIVPRRGLFSPSDWVTTQGEVKDRLLGVVGPVRTTNGISCQSHHPLQNLHDVWEDEVGQGFPTLWIGRTVFSRRAVSGRTSSLPSSAVDLHGSPSPQEDQPVEDEQSPAHGQGRGAGLPGPLHVDSGRDSAGGGGEDQRAGGRGQHPQGPRFDDVASASGHLPGDELGDAECTNEGAAATSHPGQRGQSREHDCTIRPPSGPTLQGGARLVPQVVHGGEPGESGQCVPGSHSAGELRDHEVPEHARLRSRGQLEGPLQSIGDGLEVHRVVCGELDATQVQGLRLRAEGSSTSAEAEGAAEAAWTRGDRDGAHEPGCAGRDQGGDRCTPKPFGGPEGEARDVNGESEESDREYEAGTKTIVVPQVKPDLYELGPGGSEQPGEEPFCDCLEASPEQVDDLPKVDVDSLAKRLLREQDFSHQSCEEIVKTVCQECQAGRKRKIHESTCSDQQVHENTWCKGPVVEHSAWLGLSGRPTQRCSQQGYYYQLDNLPG